MGTIKRLPLTFSSPSDFYEEQRYTIPVTCIDVLSKQAVAMPIRKKQAPDVLAGTMQSDK